MRFFKEIDLWIQGGLLVAHLIAWSIGGIDYLYLAYLTIGAWQLISCLVHALHKDQFISSRSRSKYHTVLLALLALNIVLIPVWILAGIIMLFVTPFIAIWYFVFSYNELKILRHRHLLQLK